MNRYARAATWLLTLMGLSSVIAACEGSEVRRPFAQDATSNDTTDGKDGDGAEVEGGSVDFQVVTATGARGLGLDVLALVPADELAEYAGVAGFQIDVEVHTTGVADATEARLFIDDVLIAPSDVATSEDGEGVATFRGVTVPSAAGGVSMKVTVQDAVGNTLSEDKQVTLDIGACELTVSFTETDAQCVQSVEQDGQVGVPVFASVVGDCATLRISWVLDAEGALGGILPDTTFDEDGKAEVFIALAPVGTSVEGTLEVTAIAVHADENGNDTVEVSTAIDDTAPTVTWVTPDPATSTVLGAGDDVDSVTDGVQVAFVAQVSEAGEVTLTIGGELVETKTATDAGEVAFAAVTVSGEVQASIGATDGCGNVTTLDATFTVLEASDVALVTPAADAVLLAISDDDTSNGAVYDATWVVAASGVDAGAVITILCKPTLQDELVDYTAVGSTTVATVSEDGRYDVPVAIDTGEPLLLTCIARVDTPELESESIAITLAFPGPTLALEAPINGACINTKSLPVTGLSSGLAGQQVTFALDNGQTGVVGTVDGASGEGAFAGTIAINAGAPDGAFVLSVDATDTYGNVVSDTQGDVEAGFVLDTTDPILAMTQPAGSSVGPTGDADAGTPGYQINVQATVTDVNAIDGEVCLAVNGGAPTCKDIAGATTAFTGVTLVPGANTLVLNGTDACGNAGPEVTRLITLVATNPLLIITPTDGTTLLASADGNPGTARIFEGNVVVEATGVAVLATIGVECHGSASPVFTQVGSLSVPVIAGNGRYTVPVSFDTDVLGTAIVCRATANLPFPATSPEIALTVGLPAPTVAITAPAANACLTSRTIAVSGTSSSLDGRTVTLTGATGTATVATGGLWSATGTVAADGPVTLGAGATDVFGNSATAASVSLRVDSTAPTLALQAPASTTINPDVDADEDPVTGGYQTTVRVSMTDTNVTGGEVCITVAGGAPQCVTLGATGVASFAGITLQPGDTLLTISGEDACGVAATTQTTTLTLLETGDLTVAITTPPSDLVTSATSLAFVVSVSDEDGPVVGATVSLTATGVPDQALSDNGDGTYSASVTLPQNATTAFIANATLGLRDGGSDPRSITQKGVQPTVTITAPTDGAIFNLASAACTAGQTPCITSVTATTTNTEDGSAAVLTVDCGTTSTANGTVNGNAVSFAGVSLPSGADCSISVAVTDVVGQSASDSVDVTIDRVAPTVDVTAPGVELTNADDLSVADAGVQAALVATLTGVEAGQVASAVFTWTDGGVPQTKTVTHTVATDTGDAGLYLANFEEAPGTGYVTWPQGFITVTVTVADAAGNSASDANTTAVNLPTTVRITGPTDTADTCGGSCTVGVCSAGACFRTWGTLDTRRIVTAIAGLFTTADNVRVCSDHPSLASAPGAVLCASTPSSVGPFYEVRRFSANNGNNNLDVPTQLPAGFQTLVVEVQAVANGAWVSSLSGSAANEQKRRILVDLTPPVVSALTAVSDTAPPTNTLNAAEQAAPLQYDFSFSASEAALAEVFVNGAMSVSQQVAAGTTNVRLTLPEGAVQVWVVLTDVAANKSPATPAQGAVALSLVVDITPATLTFTRPSKAILNAADNLDIVLTTSAIDGRPVTLFDGGTQVATGTTAGGSVTFSGLLSDGTHTLTATISDSANNPSSAATNPTTVLVDTLPPSVSISAPSAGQVFFDGDDADAATAGYQVGTSFTTGNGAASWSVFLSRGCDPFGANCLPRELKTTGTGTGPFQRNINVDIVDALSFMKITIEATDAAGNTASTSVDFSILITSCQIAFTNLPAGGWYNIANTCPGGNPCASATVTINVDQVGVCPPIDRLALYDGGAEIGSQDAPGSSVQFSVTVGDDDHLMLEAKALDSDGNEIGSTGVRQRDADFTRPAVSFVARSVSGFTTPAEGASVSYVASQDLDPNTAGMQMHASVDVSDTNADGGQITSITSVGSTTVVLTPSNLTLPATINGTSPIQVDLRSLALPDLQTEVVTLVAADAAGNTDTATFTAVVDVTPPAEVVITQLVMQTRRPRTLPLTFTQVGNNGMTGGPVASYDVRYSRSPIDEGNFASACSAYAPELRGSSAPPVPAAPGTVTAKDYGAPDTRIFGDPCKLDIPSQEPGLDNEVWMYWAIRAKDAAGNLSPITTQAVRGVLYKDVWLKLHTVQFNTSGGGWPSNVVIDDITYRGTSIGDVDKDGRTDFIFGSFQAKTFCVMRGHNITADETITAPTGTNHTCATLNPFGAGDISLGHEVTGLGDINGDGVDDFGVSGRLAATSSNGAVAIYLGRQGSLPDLNTPNIIVRGILPTTTVAYFGLCGVGDFDGVLTGGVATADFAITAIPSGAKNYLAVFPGRTSWTTSMAQVVIDLTGDPNPGIAAAGGLKVEWSATGGGNFGTRCGPAADFLPTPSGLGTGAKNDLFVTQTGGTDARIFILPGREWTAGTIEVLTDTESQAALVTAEDLRSVRLRQDNDTTLKSGFGATIIATDDLNNDGKADVLVAHGNRSFDAFTCSGTGCTPTAGDGKSIHIYDGSKIAAAVGTVSHRIGAPTAPASPPADHVYIGPNGWIVRASVTNNNRGIRTITDFNGFTGNGLPTIDLAFTTFAGDEARIRTNHLGGPKSFILGTFPVVDGVFENPNIGGTDSIGTWIDGGFDISGDGLKDLIAGSRKAQLIIAR